MKLNFDDDMIRAFNKMQNIYVLDEKSIITIDEVENTIKMLINVLRKL